MSTLLSNWASILLPAVAAVGVLGEAAILHNELVHSYPFKMMGMPPASFYQTIGTIGYYISIVAAVAAMLVPRLSKTLIAAVPVAVCPFVYLLVFELAHIIAGFTTQQMTEKNFDSYTGETARYEFVYEALGLIVIGSAIGLATGSIITSLTRRQNSPA